jgi:hypothetical protein
MKLAQQYIDEAFEDAEASYKKHSGEMSSFLGQSLFLAELQVSYLRIAIRMQGDQAHYEIAGLKRRVAELESALGEEDVM